MNIPDELVCEGMELELRAALPPGAGANLRARVRAARTQATEKPDRVNRQAARELADANLRHAFALAEADLEQVEADAIRREGALQQAQALTPLLEAVSISQAARHVRSAVRKADRDGVRVELRVRSPKPTA